MAIRLDEARLRLLKMYGELSPSTNNTYNVGTSSLKFANMYATTFHGALDGNANTATALTSSAGSTTQPIYFSNGKPVAITGNIANGTTGNAATATKATQDADGNTISSTYLKRSGGTMTGALGLQPVKTGTFGAVLNFYRGENRNPFKNYVVNTSTGKDSVYTCTPKANGIGVIGSFCVIPGEAYTGVNDADSSDTFNGSSRSYFSFRQYSINSSTGQILNSYEDFDFPPTPNDLATSTSYYIAVSNSNILGNSNTPVYVSDEGRLKKCSSFVPTNGGTFSGSVYFDSTIVKYGKSGYYTYIDYYRRNNAGTAGITDGYTWASGNTGAWMAWSGYAIGGVETNGTDTIYYNTYWATRAYSINSTTGARLNYYYTFRLPSVPNDLTASKTIYIMTNTNSSISSSTEKRYVMGITGTNGGVNYNTSVYTSGSVLYGACWNDYAEYRSQNELLIAGHIAYCDDDGKLKYTTERLQKFEGVVSDTFGFSIGETNKCKTPLAVSGRVLVYCDPEDHFHSGDCVCAGPNGKAYRMTREEIAMYPDRIVGVVSEIPTYKTWGSGNVEVDGRIWIRVR